MKWFHNPFRLVRVVGTFFRTGAVEQVLKITKVSKLIKFGILFMGKPFIVFGIKGPYKKSPIVRALIALGPAYIIALRIFWHSAWSWHDLSQALRPTE